jgi:hypothetical protein
MIQARQAKGVEARRLARLRARLACAVLALVGAPAHAALVGGNVGLLTQLITFTDYGTGDVVIIVAAPLATCQQGFWLRMTDAGVKAAYAQLLAAWHGGQPLTVYGWDDQLWSGSAGRYCRLDNVSYGS